MRILLIEDNTKMAQVIQTGLEQQGHSVEVVDSVQEGDQAAVAARHDAIVLDVMLPDGDGVQLCRRLRRQNIAVPILMISALGSSAQKVAGLDAGADDYLGKPFHGEELMARMRSLLRRGQATAHAVLRSGDLVVDLEQHRASCGGVELELSAKEFAMLAYMMRSPGKLLTRRMISEEVWDMNHEAHSNVIDVYVSNLRRKLGRGSTRQRIETVVGSGYRFVDHDDGDAGAADARGGRAREAPPT